MAEAEHRGGGATAYEKRKGEHGENEEGPRKLTERTGRPKEGEGVPATVFRRVQFPLDSGDNPHKIVFLQIIVCPGKHCLDSDLLTDGSGNNNKRNV